MDEIKYLEVDFGNWTDAERICIKYTGDAEPSVATVSEWCRMDEERIGHKVTAVHPIDREEADAFYDLSHEDRWPVFSTDKYVYVAVIQEPMAALDGETFVEVFADREAAEKWMDAYLAEHYGHPGEIPVDEMNYCIYQKKIQETD